MKDFISQNPAIFQFIILPALIFCAKIIEVSIGTLRLILLARKEKRIAPIVAFVEVLIWIVTIGIIFQNLTNFMAYFAYAAGFAVGNFSGMLIEEKMALGNSLIRVITRKDARKLVSFLNKSKVPITTIDAKSGKKHVSLIYIHTKRKKLKSLIRKIKKYNPHAFFSVQDVSMVSEGATVMPQPVIPKTPISKRLWGKSK